MESISQSGSSYFWDVDAAKLDIEKDSAFIIQRLFEWGDIDETRWLSKTYPLQQLKTELKSCRNLTSRSALFSANLLDVPSGELRCIQNLSGQPREIAWPY